MTTARRTPDSKAGEPHAMRPVPSGHGPLVLGGDAGGTKTWLGLFRAAGRDAAARLALQRATKYPSGTAGGLEDLVAGFLADEPDPVDFACFGLPGPVQGQQATGGVLIGGGIAARALPFLRHPSLLEAFFAKGRFGEFMRKIPLRVILNDRAALLGAARHALHGAERMASAA
ncbi:MAG: glucokinase [Chthoniobacterales bacterium]